MRVTNNSSRLRCESGIRLASACAAGTLDSGEVEPEVAAVVVFAEDDFTVAPNDSVAELVAVATLLENGSCDA